MTKEPPEADKSPYTTIEMILIAIVAVLKYHHKSLETTYVPTSLCVETSKYLPKNKVPKRMKLTERLRAWCRFERDADQQEDESTSHESPVTTPASVETQMQPSRTTSMNFRSDHRIQLQSNTLSVPSTSYQKGK
ncbi:muscarinic acetylcholine receptor DM1 [Caerostris extrusa]|uniref:Muscarinic acetylcholine receptor DM1 n=1 Tax=Caerostris extrusa TaxID=172846 RepID=A0AAV4TQK7_CAEEX|nr:muscarinic acetylcholine receptor DM1 [Caerostris extrusa]